MTQTVGDYLVDRLKAWGVRRLFDYAGDGILGALGRAGNDPAFIPDFWR